MGRLDTSKAAELRVLAETLRRRAKDMTLERYIELMRHAAEDLDAEADALEFGRPRQPGSNLNLVI
ncbi:MAG: hypothetical protein JO348_07660 [Alphaproteobacteria bacterium]|nr:hypothetical protein [Alphaproteobacteria bacterium]